MYMYGWFTLLYSRVKQLYPINSFKIHLFKLKSKQLKCPSTEKWIKKMWHIFTIEYYSTIKRNETRSFVEMWMDLENVIQSDRKRKEKQILYTNAYIWNLEK